MLTSKKDIILVIDDEADLREMVQYQFQAKGFHVVTAENGVEGLKRLEEITPDLIVLDMNMPKMGGIEFYQKICDYNARPKYPVLILTARANLEELFLGFDIHGFMSKPFDIEELVKQGTMIIQKTKGSFLKIKDELSHQTKNIYVIENDAASLAQISFHLLEAGYKVDSSRNATSAIEKIMMSPPDLVLIKLGLSDIAGDLVAFRLNRMSRTSDVKIILYVPKTDDLDLKIVQQIGEKAHTATLVKYTQYNELVQSVSQLLFPS